MFLSRDREDRRSVRPRRRRGSSSGFEVSLTYLEASLALSLGSVRAARDLDRRIVDSLAITSA